MYTYRAREVVDEVIYVLNSDAKSDDIFGHLPLSPCLGVDACVAHSAGHADQAVYTAETDADAKDLGSLDDPLRKFDISRLERQDSTSAACQ